MTDNNLEFYKNLAESLENYINQMKDPLTAIGAYAELLSANFLSDEGLANNTEAALAGKQINTEIENVFEILDKMKIARGVMNNDFEEGSTIIEAQKSKKYTKPDQKSVLIVDDDKFVCQIIQTLLKRNGFKADVVNSGEHALEEVQNKNYSIAFMDVNMPNMNGYDTLKEIIKYYESKNTQIPATIMITGYDVYPILQQCKGIGAYSLLVKPFLMDDLLKFADEAETFSQL